MDIKDLFKDYSSYDIRQIIKELTELMAEKDKKTKMSFGQKPLYIKPGQSGQSLVNGPKLIKDKLNTSLMKSKKAELRQIELELKIAELEAQIAKLSK